jgi:hypothetical protein
MLGLPTGKHGRIMNMEEKADKRLAVRVPQRIKDAFNRKAQELGKTESQALMMLVLQFVGEEVETPDIDKRFQVMETEFQKLQQRLEKEIADLKQSRLGELTASETKIAS